MMEKPDSKTLAEQDKERFGQILYGQMYDDGKRVRIIHIKIEKDGREQVYMSDCDKDYIPLAPPVYLGLWDEYANKLAESMSLVDIEGMINAKEASLRW